MQTPITDKITKLLSEGSNIETIRATGIILKSKVLNECADNGTDTPDGNKTKPSAEGNEEESI